MKFSVIEMITRGKNISIKGLFNARKVAKLYLLVTIVDPTWEEVY